MALSPGKEPDAMNAATIRIELNRLRSAPPTTIGSFMTKRAARIAELEAELAGMTEEVPVDPKVEIALRASRGGDKFGR